MRKIAYMALPVSCALSALAAEGENPVVEPAQVITRSTSQVPTTGNAENFTGNVTVMPLVKANADINASAAYVTFNPGVRSAWHTHPQGQYLIVTAGIGFTQEWGKPKQEIHVGDVVWCPPGVKHWHGASSGESMTHLAITGIVDGRSVEWLEKVRDE